MKNNKFINDSDSCDSNDESDSDSSDGLGDYIDVKPQEITLRVNQVDARENNLALKRPKEHIGDKIPLEPAIKI